MDLTSQVSLGKAVARERKLAGQTQAQLAIGINYSESHVKKVEQEKEPASPAFVAAVARYLKIEPGVITSVPLRHDDEPPLQGVAELQAILAEGKYVRPDPPGTLAELSKAVEDAHANYYGDKGKEALAALPRILRQLYGAIVAESGANRLRASFLLNRSWYLAERISRRFGYRSMVTAIIDRMESSADQAEDPLCVAQALTQRAHALMYYGDNDAGLGMVDRATGLVTDRTESGLCVLGAATLSGAIISARKGQLDTALEYIKDARLLAARVKGESPLYGTLFGSGNVDIHYFGALMEGGDPDRAAREGASLVFPPGVSAPRKGRHYQDQARAWVLAGKPQEALRALNLARKIAPEQTRAHPQVLETARAIARLEKRRTDSLANFSGWLGVKL
ncbi:multiprotein-bridging factor 1 family protein [Kutzneria sp. NPDC052558]|uniref:multiprotein-bridging factor 1 family protein n=1 Tax=Kutzneria sp. NPDC052558 TaxID=3364121 RepID=UPI0037C554DA